MFWALPQKGGQAIRYIFFAEKAKKDAASILNANSLLIYKHLKFY